MNELQTRLLLETEFEFYRLQVGSESFQRILRSLGYKPEPNLNLIKNPQLYKLLSSIRKILRTNHAF